MFNFKKLKRGLVNIWQDKKESCKIPPNGIPRLRVGESVEKRPIYCYQIGNGERKILFASAMHGNEIGTIKLAYFLLDYLSCHKEKHKKLSCYIIPCFNEDGYERVKNVAGHFEIAKGRVNARGVDLNRNFPTPNFRNGCYSLPGKNSVGAFKYRREVSLDDREAKNLKLAAKNCGAFGGSEPETKSLIDFIEKEKISVIFSFHNSGRDVMGGKNELSKKLTEIFAKKAGYEIFEEEEYEKIGQTGTMKDWCDEHDISFVEVEGSTRYGSDWKVQKPALKAVLEYLEKEHKL